MKVLTLMTDQTTEYDKWLQVLRDGNPTTRSQATYMLRKFKAPEIDEALIEALNDEDPGVIRNVAKALGYKRTEGAVDQLEKVLNSHKDPYVCIAAKKAIKKIKGIED